MMTRARSMNSRTYAGVVAFLIGCGVTFTSARAGDGERTDRNAPREQGQDEVGDRTTDRMRRAAAELEQRRMNLDAHAHELEAEMQRLRDQDGPEAEAHRHALEASMQEVRAERVALDAQHQRLRTEMHMHRLELRAEELHRMHREQVDRGRHDAAERVEREMREVRSTMERLRGEGRQREPADREAQESRLRHLRVAAEHLMAAGMEAEGRRIMEHAEQLAARQQAREIAGHEREERRERDGDPYRHLGELTDVVNDLREAMQDMREELAGIREELNAAD